MSICGGSAGDPAAKRRSPSSTGSPAAIPMRGVRRAATKRHADETPPNNGRGTWQDVRRQGRSPRVDDRDPADAIHEMVSHVLGLAETWVAWDGKPVALVGASMGDTGHGARPVLLAARLCLFAWTRHLREPVVQTSGGRPRRTDTTQANHERTRVAAP